MSTGVRIPPRQPTYLSASNRLGARTFSEGSEKPLKGTALVDLKLLWMGEDLNLTFSSLSANATTLAIVPATLWNHGYSGTSKRGMAGMTGLEPALSSILQPLHSCRSLSSACFETFAEAMAWSELDHRLLRDVNPLPSYRMCR